jgi:hypothetical protein
MTPQSSRVTFDRVSRVPTKQILNDAEDDLREWQPELEDVSTGAPLNNNLMPAAAQNIETDSVLDGTATSQGTHLAHHNDDITDGGAASRVTSGASVTTGPTYAPSEAEQATVPISQGA